MNDLSKNTTASIFSQLDKETQDVVDKAMQTQNTEDMKNIVALFNLNIAKKNILRVLKCYDLLDTVTNLTEERFKKRPDELTYKELLDSVNVFQSSIEKTSKAIDAVNDKPAIQLNQQNNNVNINVIGKDDTLNGLKRESRLKVMGAITAFLRAAKELPDSELQEEVSEGDNK